MTLLQSLADTISDLCLDEKSLYTRWRSSKNIGDDFAYIHRPFAEVIQDES
jgi:hypothetical protein